MKRKRFSEEQIIGILKEDEAGVKNQDICRKQGITEQTFYRWRSKYGGMQVSEAKKFRELPTGTQIWVAAGVTELRRGFTRLSATIQTALEQNPSSGHAFDFRGRRGDLIKMLGWDGDVL